MQAQDYPGVKWSIGLRSTNLTDTAVEDAISSGAIVRTWPMRGTLHFVAAEDVRWMLSLLAPRAIAATATRRRQLELDEVVLGLACHALEASLRGGRRLTREELFAAFEQTGIATRDQRGIHILGWASQTGLICQGPMRGKQATFGLLDEWVPQSPVLPREKALGRLALRYLESHGPATAADLSWWSGLTLTESRSAIASVRSRLESVRCNDVEYWMTERAGGIRNDVDSVLLLPGFDEFLLGYRDRSAALDPEFRDRIVPGGNGVFKPTIIVDGRVVGAWSRTATKRGTSISLHWFPDTEPIEVGRIERYVDRYSRFVGRPAMLE